MKSRLQGLLVLAFLLSSVTSLYALDILVESFRGDVDVKQGTQPWQPAQPGMKLSPGDMVSTGFDSEAKLRFADDSVVTVKPLSQLTIDRFLEEERTVRTDVALKIGEIKAEIERRRERKSDFVVITPTSVVSVRGTEEDVRSSDIGTEVQTHEGVVQAQNEQGHPTRVAEGQEATIVEEQVPVTPIDHAVDHSRADTFSGVGLTSHELAACHGFVDPTFDPGVAVFGQGLTTQEEHEAHPGETAQHHS